MMDEPRGRSRKVDEAALRECVAAGMTPVRMATHFGVSQAAISQRLKRLNLRTAAAATVAPEESRRYVRSQLDIMEQLRLNLTRANLLMDACDEWLKDPENEQVYAIGPRSEEVDVHYTVEVRTDNGFRTMKRKKSLAELLGLLEGQDEDGARFSTVEKAECKHADPRELILKTHQETRQTVALVLEAMQKIADQRAMETLRESIIAEVAKESPDVASRIAQAVRRSILLHTALGGIGALAAGGGEVQ